MSRRGDRISARVRILAGPLVLGLVGAAVAPALPLWAEASAELLASVLPAGHEQVDEQAAAAEHCEHCTGTPDCGCPRCAGDDADDLEGHASVAVPRIVPCDDGPPAGPAPVGGGQPALIASGPASPDLARGDVAAPGRLATHGGHLALPDPVPLSA